MDIASLIGFLGAVGMILGAMISGGGIAPFIDVASILIVFGGTFFAVMYTAPLPTFLASFGVMAKAFLPPVKKQDVMIERMVELAGIARKDGMMALEGQEVPDKFFEKGLQMLVDGADEAKLTMQLKQEIKSMKARHEANQGVIKAWVDLAPAMGMIGTLVGLVLMLGNMADPKAIGPAMAVALLTTLYGAFIANIMFAPMLTKLEGYTFYESNYREMVVEGLRNIARGESPRNIQDQLLSNLPPKMQEKLAAGPAPVATHNGVTADVIDDEEFSLISELKSAKASYRAAFDKLTDERATVEYVSGTVEQCRGQLLADFTKWLATERPEAAASISPVALSAAASGGVGSGAGLYASSGAPKAPGRSPDSAPRTVAARSVMSTSRASDARKVIVDRNSRSTTAPTCSS